MLICLRRCFRWFRSPANFYLFIGGLLALSFVFLTPPYQVPDENTHFTKAYALANGQIRQHNGGHSSGVMAPHELSEQYELNKLNLDGTYNFKAKLLNSWRIDISSSSMQFFEMPNLASYHFVSYLPQAIGIKIASLFTNKLIIMFYAARLVNALLCVALIWSALKILPRGKWLFAALGILPMTVFLAGSVSADALTIGITALFAATVLAIYYNEKAISNKQIALLAASTAVLALSKQVYILVTLASVVILLRPSEGIKLHDKPELKRRIVALVIALSLAVLLFGSWQLINNASSSIVYAQRSSGLRVDPAMQVETIKTNPSRFIEVVTNSFFGDAQKDIVWSFFGNFGGLNRPTGFWILLGMLISLLLLFGVETKRQSKLVAIYFLGITILSFVIMMMGLYVLWTPIDSEKILGFQGRYLIPLAFLCFPACAGAYRHSIPKRHILNAYVILVVLCCLGVFLSY